ncbi:glycosyltransferase [Terrabacter sp. Ter38]|uniref:glycosyltransferase n=1 Tax=Terrabacter sp. Ter38 TaxID=2926030 RepID=UPI002118AE88|nr:glycosyltransferase [Terrabacter sp. Ter38]
MRMLFATTAGTGHFGPMVPVARACVEAGHEVRVAAPESFANHVEHAGLEHVPFDDVAQEVMGAVFARLPSMSPEEANATVVRDVFGRLDAQAARPRVQELVDAWAPDVVLREPCEFGSLAAAVRSGVPHVEMAIGLGSLQRWAGQALVDPLGELDVVAGLDHGSCAAAMSSAAVLSQVPPSLDVPDHLPGASGVGAQDVTRVTRYRDGAARSGSGTLPTGWGDPDLPLVYVTFGSVTAGFDALSSVFELALDALADLPVRVFLTTGHAGDPESLRPWPDNAHVERWWPQDDVMPLASAVVGHGGFGTMMSALVAGVPQVLVPLFAFDQEVNARRIEEVGAGVRLAGRHGAMAELSGALTRVLADTDIRSRAAALADEIAALPDASEMVGTVEAIAVGG